MQDQLRALALRFLKRGAPIYKVAFRLGIDLEELRNLEIRETLYQLARSGRHTSATIFWLKTRSSAVALAEEEYPDPPIIRAIDKDGNLYG